MQGFLKEGLDKMLNVKCLNGPMHGDVNENSGSDYILKKKNLPENLNLKKGETGFACDGDGDRIILFYKNSQNQDIILNGDKILALLCLGFKQLMNMFPVLSELKMGAISTLYSDGNLKIFVESLEIPYYIEPTGVKNMFQRTKELDISFVVEFNGHSLVFFSKKAKQVLLGNESTKNIFENIFNLNCDSGDFISIFFLLQFLMKLTQISLKDVDDTFKVKHRSLMQVKVKNKNIVEMDERSGIHYKPKDLAEFIEEIMGRYQKERLRVFVRKSGTEELVRILLECESREVIDEIAPRVEEFIQNHSQINPEH
jgi:phosphomannomutase